MRGSKYNQQALDALPRYLRCAQNVEGNPSARGGRPLREDNSSYITCKGLYSIERYINRMLVMLAKIGGRPVEFTATKT